MHRIELETACGCPVAIPVNLIRRKCRVCGHPLCWHEKIGGRSLDGACVAQVSVRWGILESPNLSVARGWTRAAPLVLAL
ncbi:hypothetical protein KFU94_11095 [Chloroflexi bacterium TSY]|nr:hypothetical protein [Chloroflexi bacterium TSY]